MYEECGTEQIQKNGSFAQHAPRERRDDACVGDEDRRVVPQEGQLFVGEAQPAQKQVHLVLVQQARRHREAEAGRVHHLTEVGHEAEHEAVVAGAARTAAHAIRKPASEREE